MESRETPRELPFDLLPIVEQRQEVFKTFGEIETRLEKASISGVVLTKKIMFTPFRLEDEASNNEVHLLYERLRTIERDLRHFEPKIIERGNKKYHEFKKDNVTIRVEPENMLETGGNLGSNLEIFAKEDDIAVSIRQTSVDEENYLGRDIKFEETEDRQVLNYISSTFKDGLLNNEEFKIASYYTNLAYAYLYTGSNH